MTETRKGRFEPQIIGRRERRFVAFDQKIVAMHPAGALPPVRVGRFGDPVATKRVRWRGGEAGAWARRHVSHCLPGLPSPAPVA